MNTSLRFGALAAAAALALTAFPAAGAQAVPNPTPDTGKLKFCAKAGQFHYDADGDSAREDTVQNGDCEKDRVKKGSYDIDLTALVKQPACGGGTPNDQYTVVVKRRGSTRTLGPFTNLNALQVVKTRAAVNKTTKITVKFACVA